MRGDAGPKCRGCGGEASACLCGSAVALLSDNQIVSIPPAYLVKARSTPSILSLADQLSTAGHEQIPCATFPPFRLRPAPRAQMRRCAATHRPYTGLAVARNSEHSRGYALVSAPPCRRRHTYVRPSELELEARCLGARRGAEAANQNER